MTTTRSVKPLCCSLLEQLRELTRGGAQVSVSQPFYAPF